MFGKQNKQMIWKRGWSTQYLGSAVAAQLSKNAHNFEPCKKFGEDRGLKAELFFFVSFLASIDSTLGCRCSNLASTTSKDSMSMNLLRQVIGTVVLHPSILKVIQSHATE